MLLIKAKFSVETILHVSHISFVSGCLIKDVCRVNSLGDRDSVSLWNQHQGCLLSSVIKMSLSGAKDRHVYCPI